MPDRATKRRNEQLLLTPFERFNNRFLDEDAVTRRVDRNRDMADALLNQNANTFVRSPTQGLAILARALNARDFNKLAEKDQKALTDQRNQQLGDLLASLPQGAQQRAAGLPRGVLESVAGRNLLDQLTPGADKQTSKQFREGDNFVTRRVVNGVPDMSDAGILSSSRIDRRQQIEQGPPGSFETSGARDDERKRKRNVLALTGELAEGLRNVQQFPRSTGMVGAAAQGVNALGDVPVVGNWITTITENATGLDPAELAQVRTQAESMVAKLVPVITGDISGRYTDKEQDRTRDIQAQSKFWKTSAQVLGGLGELQSIQIRGEIRQDGQGALDAFAGQSINLGTAEDIDTWGEILVQDYGLTEAKALEEIRKHRNLMGF